MRKRLYNSPEVEVMVLLCGGIMDHLTPPSLGPEGPTSAPLDPHRRTPVF